MPPAWSEGETSPPELLLAEIASATLDPRDYLISEKLDGVRAYWDGQVLRFRGGRLIDAPAWFTQGFPDRPLDGELWLARGRFDALSGLVRQSPPDDEAWRGVTYCLFELPGAPGTFAERYAALQSLVAQSEVPWLTVIPQFSVVDRAELARRFRQMIKEGAEGLMLHRADAPYRTGRSDVLLKLKPHQDAEARVIGYLPGQGKWRGQVGALRVRTEQGVEFSVGSGLSAALRHTPPPLGTRLTYRYDSLTPQGKPRFPRFVRLRPEPL